MHWHSTYFACPQTDVFDGAGAMKERRELGEDKREFEELLKREFERRKNHDQRLSTRAESGVYSVQGADAVMANTAYFTGISSNTISVSSVMSTSRLTICHLETSAGVRPVRKSG